MTDMTAEPHDIPEFDDLLILAGEGELTDAQHERLEAIITSDAAARGRYLDYMTMHVMLRAKLADSTPPIALQRGDTATDFRRLPEAEVEAAGDASPAVVGTIGGSSRGGGWLGRLAVAAAIVVVAGVSASLLWQASRPNAVDIAVHTPPRTAVAMLAETHDASWTHAGSDLLEPGMDLEPGEMKLASGSAQMLMGKGAVVELIGPAEMRLDDPNRCLLREGTVVAYVPPSAKGFTVDTRAAKIVDLGTEFAVASFVTADMRYITQIEVYRGKVEFTPAASSQRIALVAGQAKQVTVDTMGVATVADLPTNEGVRTRPGGQPLKQNVALGKPVTASGFYNKAAETFPPQNVTDGRLNDTGTPGHWSFWLSPDGEPGSVTVDLQAVYRVDEIAVQNTRNRVHADRGTKDFHVEVSLDGKTFTEVARDTLRQIDFEPKGDEAIPFESFRFDPVDARYVRFTGDTWYTRPGLPATLKGSVGLNELRVYTTRGGDE